MKRNQWKMEMQKLRNFIFLFAFLISLPNLAQSTDLARLEYTYFPQKNSDNSFRRFRAQAAFPIRLKKEGTYLVPGIEYRNVEFKYEDPENFDTFDLDRFQSATFTLGYTFKMNEFWRFGAEGGVKIASNFSESYIESDDLIYTGAVYFLKMKNAYRWILGLKYSTTTGFPFPLPIINYSKELNDSWSFMVGTPKSNLKYYFNDRHAMQAFITLDGFFANVQRNFDIAPRNPENNQIAESMSMTILLSGLGYEFGFTDHFKFYIYGGHTLLNDIRLRDADRNNIYTINDTNTFYGRSGLKFTIF